MEIELRRRTKSSSQDETMWWNSESSVLCRGTRTVAGHTHTHTSGQPVINVLIGIVCVHTVLVVMDMYAYALVVN